MTALEEQYKALMDALKPGEILIFTRTEDGRLYKGEGDKTGPNGKGKWVNNNGDMFGGEFIDGVANGGGNIKLDGKEFKGVWENAVMKTTDGESEGTVTFHIEDLNFDNISEKLIYQKDENGEIRVFQYK